MGPPMRGEKTVYPERKANRANRLKKSARLDFGDTADFGVKVIKIFARSENSIF